MTVAARRVLKKGGLFHCPLSNLVKRPGKVNSRVIPVHEARLVQEVSHGFSARRLDNYHGSMFEV